MRKSLLIKIIIGKIMIIAEKFVVKNDTQNMIVTVFLELSFFKLFINA